MPEFATSDELKYTFFRVSDNFFTFKVRCPNDAHVALTSEPFESDNMYEIFLGGWGNSKSVIRKNRQKPDVVEVSTPSIVNGNEFNGFWIRWCDNVITVGREGESAAFMYHEESELIPINYIGICTGWGASGTWLIDDEPASAVSPKLSIGDGKWVEASNGDVPPNAFEGGFDQGEPLYVARARHEQDLIPGKLLATHGVCFVPWGGEEHSYNEYEVLCDCGGQWVSATEGNIPANAIPGGVTGDGSPLFIGRATHNDTLTIGKVQTSHCCCYISYGGKEFAYKDYEVLVSNQ